MNIDEPLRNLGDMNIDALRDAVLAQDDTAWLEQSHRQEEYEVHKQTRSIVLVFCDGWPEVTVTKEAGWDRLAEQAVPIMQDIVER